MHPPGTIDELAAEPIVPARAGLAAMTPEQAVAALASLPSWSLDATATRLRRRHVVAGFAEAFAVVTRIAALAEAADHHPDLSFGWGYVAISLHTHVLGGLHRNDVVLAARIERILA